MTIQRNKQLLDEAECKALYPLEVMLMVLVTGLSQKLGKFRRELCCAAAFTGRWWCFGYTRLQWSAAFKTSKRADDLPLKPSVSFT
jgi:hypothetical protein